MSPARARSSASCRSPSTSPVFTGIPGKFVPIEETVKSFKAVAGEYDHLPEATFNGRRHRRAVAKAAKLEDA